MKINPTSKEEFPYQLSNAIRRSGLTQRKILEILDKNYGIKITEGGLTRAIWNGTIKFQMALLILVECGVDTLEITTSKSSDNDQKPN